MKKEYQMIRNMKKEYQSPQIKVVGFRVEIGFGGTSGGGEEAGDDSSIPSSTVQNYDCSTESEQGYVFGEGIPN